MALSKFIHLACFFSILQCAVCTTGVCTYQRSSTQTYQVYVSVSSNYETGCYWFFRCTETRYRAVTEMRNRVVYHTVQECCPGYEGNVPDCTPICDDCVSPGQCVAPDVCQCPEGFTGDECSDDINECEVDVCSNCMNTHGSFLCTCPDGTTLPSGEIACIDPPQMVSVNTITSTSLNVTWDPPMLLDEQLDHYSVSCSNEEEDPLIIMPSNLSVSITNLLPYTTYICCISAETITGVSRPICVTQSTFEDVPSGPPENVTVTAVSPFALEIEWNIPTLPNGAITNYTIYTNSVSIDSVNGSHTSYVYNGLSPYQEVSVSVSASTAVGEGPQSIETTTRTRESAPGIVETMDVLVISNNSFNVSWTPPLSPNGIIIGYRVTINNLINNTKYEITVESDDMFRVSVSDNIGPYVPYGIVVAAITSAGIGDAQEYVIFTQQGSNIKFPSVAPIIHTVERTDAKSVLIEWNLLTFEQLRGNLTSYEIVYFELMDECISFNSSSSYNRVSVQTMQPLFSLTEVLDPGLRYCISIAAKTTAGVGQFSYRPVHLYSNSEFTLVIEVTSCQVWIDELPYKKTEDLIVGISNGIEQYCQCDFPTEYIADTHLHCDEKDPEIVIFEGRIIGTEERNDTELYKEFQSWASDKPTVIVQGEQVQVSARTEETEQEDTTGGLWTIAGPVIAVVILLIVVAFTLLIVSAVVWRRKPKRQKVENETIQTNTRDDDFTDTLKALQNPFYGYGDHKERDTEINDEGYSTVTTKPITTIEQVANPSYGMREIKNSDMELVPNPLYGDVIPPNTSKTDMLSTSAGGLYSEIPVVKEYIYDAPDSK